MDISPAGNGSFYIYLKGEELNSLPTKPSELTVNEAALLVKEAIGEQALSAYCLELYAGRESMLLFARSHSDKPVFYTFSCAENLIEGAKTCRAGLTSFLVMYEERYYLVVYPGEAPETADTLSEFGEKQNQSAYFALFLNEHGTALAGPDAIDMIKKVF